MRLLHTADWHLGRRFNHWDLLESQAAFVDWLVAVVRDEQIDAVLIAGDLFDRAVPPQPAVELAGEALARIVDAGAAVVAISGNHDSAQRLGFGAPLMAAAGVHIRTERRDGSGLGVPVTLQPRRRPGDEPVTVIPVPYLDPLRLDPVEGVERTHHGVTAHVAGLGLAAALKGGCRTAACIVMGHCFVNGGAESDSERALSVGGSSLVELAAFGDAGYVALGHLHRPQGFDGGRVRYAGSPIALSFSEEHAKEVRILEANGGIASRAVPVDVGRPVRTLRGTLEEILGSAAFADAEASFVRVQLTDAEHRLGAMEAVQRRFPFAGELAYVDLARQGEAAASEIIGPARLRPREIIRRYTERTLGDEVAPWVEEIVDRAYRSAGGEDGA